MQVAAPRPPDPRTVVTPLLPDLVESELRSLGIYEKWKEVVDGLRCGFNVGALAPVTETLIFPNHASSELVSTFISCISVRSD